MHGRGGASGSISGSLLTGSAAAIVFAHVVRFVAIAHGAIDGALGRVTPSMELAARTLGSTRRRVLARIHVPMIRGSILTAALLIFVDSAKELPATLILRPFDFETLATSLYNAASLEKLGPVGSCRARHRRPSGSRPSWLLARTAEPLAPRRDAPALRRALAQAPGARACAASPGNRRKPTAPV